MEFKKNYFSPPNGKNSSESNIFSPWEIPDTLYNEWQFHTNSYESILNRVLLQGLEIKGQMVDCPESETILFVGTPFLDGLDGLTGHGLFISDIPIHDATRDVILVGEQARAQVRFSATLGL